MVTPSFDKFAKNYDQILSESLGSYGQDISYYAKYKVSLARKLTSGNVRTILDFGCGRGQSISLLRDAFPGAVVDGCDISEESLSLARLNYPETTFFNCGNVSHTASRKYDLIFIANVLHHIPPERRPTWMLSLRDLLGDGGRIVFFEHNPFNPIVRYIVRHCPLDNDAVLVWQKQLVKLIQDSGLNCTKRGYTLFFSSSLNRLAIIEQWIEWLPLGAQYYVLATSNKDSLFDTHSSYPL